MIPLLALALGVGILSVLICVPLIVYAGIRGKHLKDPFKGSLVSRSSSLGCRSKGESCSDKLPIL